MASPTPPRPRAQTRIGRLALVVGSLNLVVLPLWIGRALSPMELVPALLVAIALVTLAVLSFAVAHSMLKKPTPLELERRTAQARESVEQPLILR